MKAMGIITAHHRKAYRDDKSRAFEDAEPVGDVGIIEAIVQVGRHAGDEDGTEHAHVQRFDVGNHGQSCAGAGILTVVHTEVSTMQGKETGDEIVEQHVDDETFHRATGLLLFGKTDWHGDGEEDGHLGEYRPGPLLDHIPEVIPDCPLRGDTPQYAFILADDGQCYRQTKECEQDDRRIHGAAKPLHPLHHAVFADCHMNTP